MRFNDPALPFALTLFAIFLGHLSGLSINLFSDDTSIRAGKYRSSGKKINSIKYHFDQIRASRRLAVRQYSNEQLNLLDEIYQVSETKKENCHLEYFKKIQKLINKKAKFHFSTIPFLKYHFWLQFLMCKDELGEQLFQNYETKLSKEQKDDLKLLYEKTTNVRGYAYKLLFDDITKKQTKLLTSVLLDGSGTFMKFRGAHIWDILVKHDKDFQFAKEHAEIVLKFCVDINEPMREFMDIFNEVIVDQSTLWSLSLEPRTSRVYFQVKICQKIIDYEEKILDSAHNQLHDKSSHLENWLIFSGRRRKNFIN